MKKLKIGMLAPIWLSIPPKKYGGTEWIIHHLTEGLVKKGHNVTLFASGDSKTSAKLVSVYPRSLRSDNIPWADQSYPLLNVATTFENAKKFDIIHSHVDRYDLYFTRLTKTPVVSTMHNRLIMTEHSSKRFNIYRHYNKHRLIAISKSQRDLALQYEKFNFVGIVYNSIDINAFHYNPEGSDGFIWIARIAKNKGIENAIRACEILGAKLTIAGTIDYTNIDYFNTTIKPHIDGKKIKFIGEINKSQKSKFFGNAKALLYPIEWDEPFGLVMTEAMACGTPVIAYDRGSVSEVVRNNFSGFVIPSNIRSLTNAMKKVSSIRRENCRELVKENFSIQKMVDSYEKIYYQIIKQHGNGPRNNSGH